MNGIIERGELYWVKVGDAIGSEEAAGRPGVIISSKKGNETSNTLLIAYTTTQVKYGIINPSTYASGRKTWILCNQIQTVDKMRLGRYIGKLTDQEMRAVDDGLETAMDLGYVDDITIVEKDKEIEALKVKIAELTGEVAREQAKVIEVKAKHEDELLSYKLENAMWQKCYDKTMDMLVRTTVEGTYASRIMRETPVEEAVSEDPPAEPVEAEEDLVDINHCTKRDLTKIGFSEVIARAVIAARPFETVEGLKKVPYMNKKKYQILSPKLCCTPLEIIEIPAEPVVKEEPEVVEPEGKVNINFVLAKELHEKTGLALSTCYRITKYRRDNGPYTKLEDLLNVPQVFPGTLEKLRDKIEIGSPDQSEEPVEEEEKKKNEPCPGKKLNVNTATFEEMMSIGLGYNASSRIRSYRNKHGKFEKLEDLLKVGRFGERALEKWRPMLEV